MLRWPCHRGPDWCARSSGGAAAAGAAQHGQPKLRQPDIRPEAAFLAGLAGTMADAMTPAEQAAPQRVASELQAYACSTGTVKP